MRFVCRISLAVLFLGIPVSSLLPMEGVAQELDGVPPIFGKRYPKLESTLAQLVIAWQESCLPQFAAQRAIEVLPEGKIRVIIEAELGKTDTVKEIAKGLGCEVELDYENLIQALVPIPKLIQLGETDEVRQVRLPFRFVPLVESEGVGVINADDWHAQGLSGNGLKVGILDGGFSGYQALLGTELPNIVTTWWAPSIGGLGTSVHGTACAEIVYDIAPDASFYLANFSTGVEWANAIDWLIGQGVNVISCSMGWLNTGPGNGTGLICAKVEDARNAGVLWAQSAGNQAQRHWSGDWSDPDNDGWLNFAFGDETNTIFASKGDRITVGLRWNDPWGASNNDYDLYLLDADNHTVAFSANPQSGTQDPTETLVYTAAVTGNYHIAVWLHSADGKARFDLFTFRQNLEYRVEAGSLLEPADSPKAMTVGAVPWHNPDTLEDFSSRGPTTDGRIKPDLVGPDGVSTATYLALNKHFYGTSAAAPHGAGAALLVKQRFPGYLPAQIQGYMESHAVDLGPVGKDNLYGSGRLHLPMNNPPNTPTLISPADGETVSLTPGLRASAFSDPDPDDWHANSHWQVDNNSNFSSPEWDSGESYPATTQVTVPSGRLAYSTTYYWRVRYKDSRGAWSSWSSSRYFTTQAAPLPTGFQVRRETGDVLTPGRFYGKDFISTSGDLAEWVSVSEPVEPGDVLELDPTKPGYYRKSLGPCSHLVAGVVSSQPGFALGAQGSTEGKVLLALLGIVPVKVTDEGGPIQPGDLLITSSTPGYAMRWNPELGFLCGFVGKALEPLTNGRGIINVLLMTH